MTANMTSLRSTDRRNELECYLLDEGLDVLLVQETKWDSTLDSGILNFPGYKIAARQDRVPDNIGGGCAIYVKDHVM